MKASLLWVVAVLLLAACGGPDPTPTPVPDDRRPGPTLPPEEAGAMPVQVTDRDIGTDRVMYDPMGTPFAVITPFPSMTFELDFTNLMGRDLAGFRGVLVFMDSAGNELEGFSTHWILEELKAGETKEIEYTIVATEHIPSRQKLKEHPASDITVLFKPLAIRLPDGSTELLPTPTPR
jgi:hypothetical protein